MRTLLVTLALLAAGSIVAQPLEPSYPPLNGDTFLEMQLFLEANIARGNEGLPPLSLDAGLTLAARHHAAEMAALGYFSHNSPRPEHGTLRHRLALAGSPLVTVGENLAMMQGQPELALTAVQGWLDSPGHRANLLGPSFSHVGYGAAVDAGGATIIVQVLAFKPGTLQRTAVERRVLTERRFVVVLRASSPMGALLSVSGAGDVPLDLTAGTHQIEITSVAELGEQVQIRAGVALDDTGSFVLQDAGWLDTRTGVWTADGSSTRQGLVIESVTIEQTTTSGAAVTLAYDLPPGRQLAVFLGDAHQRDAVAGAGLVTVVLGDDGFATPLQIGVLTGSRVQIFHSFTVTSDDGVPVLHPDTP